MPTRSFSKSLDLVAGRTEFRPGEFAAILRSVLANTPKVKPQPRGIFVNIIARDRTHVSHEVGSLEELPDIMEPGRDASSFQMGFEVIGGGEGRVWIDFTSVTGWNVFVKADRLEVLNAFFASVIENFKLREREKDENTRISEARLSESKELASTQAKQKAATPGEMLRSTRAGGSRIYYIVLADLVGSRQFNAKMGNDIGRLRLRQFESAAKQALSTVRPESSGRIIKTEGDAVLMLFDHFPDVVSWKLEFDASLHSEVSLTGLGRIRMPDMEPMEARVWVHVGEVLVQDSDAHGLAVSDLHKIEQTTKLWVSPGRVVLTKLAHEIAVAALFPRQCELKAIEIPGLSSERMLLYELIVKADVAFVMSRQKA